MDKEIMRLLYRIRQMESTSDRVRTHKVIWSGRYDVWQDEQDRIDQLEIPKTLMREAEALGLIRSECRKIDRYETHEWSLTELGWTTILKEDNGTHNK